MDGTEMSVNQAAEVLLEAARRYIRATKRANGFCHDMVLVASPDVVVQIKVVTPHYEHGASPVTETKHVD
jgi:hypothetical protein